MTITRMQEPRQLYGLGSFVKSVGKAVTGGVKKVAKGIKSFAKSDLGKAALLATAGMYAGGLGPFASGARFGNLAGAGFLRGIPAALSTAQSAFSSMGPTGKFFTVAGLGSLGAGLLGIAEQGGLDTSDPNAQVDLESLKDLLLDYLDQLQ